MENMQEEYIPLGPFGILESNTGEILNILNRVKVKVLDTKNIYEVLVWIEGFNKPFTATKLSDGRYLASAPKSSGLPCFYI